MASKDWKKSDIISGRGIYGINGNYIWESTHNPKRVIELTKVIGGGTAIILHRGDGYTDTIPESGIGFRLRSAALKAIRKYMKENN